MFMVSDEKIHNEATPVCYKALRIQESRYALSTISDSRNPHKVLTPEVIRKKLQRLDYGSRDLRKVSYYINKLPSVVSTTVLNQVI